MKAKERIIYDDYDLWEDYYEYVLEYFKTEMENDNPSDDEIWEEIYIQDRLNWECELALLKEFFNGSDWILQGTTGLWHGNYDSGFVFDDFEDMLYSAMRDCDYMKLYDVNGHFYIECSHHDGTNFYEVKRITDRGLDYLENWENSYKDKRTEQYVHNKIMEKYSTLPHFAHNVYGCVKREYEKGVA